MTSNKLAVFDWNGTILADSHITWRATSRCIEHVSGQRISRARYHETMTFPLIDMYLANGCDEARVNETMDEQWTLFMEEYNQGARTCRTRPGVRALLSWLDQKGVQSIILSNHVEHDIRSHLYRLRLADRFHHVFAQSPENDSILYKTSKQARLQTYLETHGFAPESVVMFGDSTEEPEIAKALGLICISVSGGAFSTPRLRAANPHHLVRKISDAIPILERHWR
jgi:phosphoglycolate phosphatase-like HAD superfamily hydrolase